MSTRVFSFSTKSQEDYDFMMKLKQKSSKTGISFSHTVIRALKELEEREAKAKEKSE